MKQKIKVGGSLAGDLAEIALACEAWERGEAVEPLHVLAFEDAETFLRVLTPTRLRLFRHLQHHAEPSVRSLSRALDRDYSRVHGDVTRLEAAGLLVRRGKEVRAVAGRVQVNATL